MLHALGIMTLPVRGSITGPHRGTPSATSGGAVGDLAHEVGQLPHLDSRQLSRLRFRPRGGRDLRDAVQNPSLLPAN
jgi:hypothetical protein